ncbi:MAG: type II secretion system F family protein [Candidatus Melainabacteria bacterium]|nr:type II secretion system F family protein [Candidatus Melainabacteria bacterium]MBI3308551.1 type II secretion system F family protein [Candidatus Melainabacteria bacterium]
MSSIILIAIAVFLAVVFLTAGIYFLVEYKQSVQMQSKRVEQAVSIETQEQYEPGESGTQNVSLRRDTRISSIKWLDKLLSRLLKERSKKLLILIEQTGLRIKVSEFVLFTALIGFVGLLIVDLFLHIPIVGFGTVIVPFILLNILKVQRRDAFSKQLPQALDLLSSDLRAGLDIQAGLKHISEEFPAPIGEEFAKVVVEVNLGLTLANALNNLSGRIDTMDVQMLCTGIIINRELGGNLSELIQNISNTVRERFRLKGMIKALTAENEMSAILLIALPIGLFFLLNLMSPDIYGVFLTDPTGRIILGGCIVSMVIGYIVMKQLTKVEV